MKYRRLGNAGLQVSELSLGSWITFHNQIDQQLVLNCMTAARDAGVNFFDNAEAYGEAENMMGAALKKLNWRRGSYIISTKLYWGLNEGVNERKTLNRKYLLEGITGSLKRLQMDHVDLIHRHRPDPNTPVEEAVWAMHDIVSRGYAHYWGTSEWGAEQIEEAFKIAEKEHLRKPVMEQPEYNMFSRDRVEKEYAPLIKNRGLGLTTWSPLASGLLSGKYLNGVPKNSRLSLSNMQWLKDKVLTPPRMKAVAELDNVAKECGCTLAQLSLAWCLLNPAVSTVITGATKVEQVRENMAAVQVRDKITKDVADKIERILKQYEVEASLAQLDK